VKAEKLYLEPAFIYLGPYSPDISYKIHN